MVFAIHFENFTKPMKRKSEEDYLEELANMQNLSKSPFGLDIDNDIDINKDNNINKDSDTNNDKDRDININKETDTDNNKNNDIDIDTDKDVDVNNEKKLMVKPTLKQTS